MGAWKQVVRLYRILLSPWEDPTLMALFGSRLTLVANVCALLIVPMMIYTAGIITQQCRGYERPQDAPLYLLPAIVMIVIRRQLFSFCFLLFYIWQMTEMALQARNLGLGIQDCGDRLGEPLQYTLVLLIVSIICLAIYIAYLAVVAVVSVAKFIAWAIKDEE
ncbi:conserved membrane protein of unknown function [Bradyrhizobium sp. ORS 285]|uniref:hypothetical protein n=1 Tax=Bradyrhizobium sp. ORS 285 TaxID=115808 RepID=UPI0002405CB2|nr:hypothetical protein [Bradyrhizobium sp. ORS 285]CCD88891.1 conserved membrane hypothetical protein [Bradyrhizobium sp. ORS 285]SMX56709.1 conserved membrane protein of unknown function [Bradyrhizobium sp. ORS 285]